MGANAQTSVPTFTAGEVLTAANMNISARTGIPVFADATARDAAFGGTGEKTLAEGQFAYLESTNATQYYDGSAWQAVAGSSGLTLIKTQTIGTTVASVEVTGAFSSTYDNYLITVSGGVGSTGAELQMTLGATTTGYSRFLIYGLYSSNTVNGAATSNGANWAHAGTFSTDNINAQINLYSPNLAKNTHMVSACAGAGSGIWQNGYLANTTQYTAFTFTTSSGTITGGTIRVYGYQNS
jgi:1,6-anhydro-N-acetylmuramate kinase